MDGAPVLDSVTEGESAALPPEMLEALRQVVEVDDTLRRRVEYSSDASNYRVQPAAVAFPRNASEVEDVSGLHVRELAG